jgi:YbbR domain-containing protein
MKFLNSRIVTALCILLAAGMFVLVTAEAVNSFTDFYQTSTAPSNPGSGQSRQPVVLLHDSQQCGAGLADCAFLRI